jgi:hypothetical protein
MVIRVPFAPQAQHHADDSVTALDKERGDGRAIYAAAHGDDDRLRNSQVQNLSILK